MPLGRDTPLPRLLVRSLEEERENGPERTPDATHRAELPARSKARGGGVGAVWGLGPAGLGQGDEGQMDSQAGSRFHLCPTAVRWGVTSVPQPGGYDFPSSPLSP